jgi:hypothetical protein
MIRYEPSKIIKKLAPDKKIKQALKSNLSLKKAAFSFVDSMDVLDKKDITRVALKTIKGYKKRIKDDPELRAEILADPAQLIQRVQNEVIFQMTTEIRATYQGEFYKWLPSDADEPDPEHQLNYGKTFEIDEGEMPGDRIGCRCGMEILVKDSDLNLTGE